ncbi:MAG: hypothetical protein LCH81_20115 [Bacteroidetes bacterium]|nr:hypothetical protein [Bacteroidota bacterium]
MRKKIKFLLIWVIISEAAFSQQLPIAYRYANTDLFKNESVVFTENYHPPIKLPAGTKLFTPSIQDIIQSEQILIEQYNILMKKEGWQEQKNIKRKYYKYKRQYIGFLDSKGDKKIIVNLLNFKRCKKPDANYPNWDSEYLVGFGSYYEKNTRRYVINLDSRMISLNTFD